MSVDCERWLNELTHKYLEYVRKCHLHGYTAPLQYDIENEFEKLKYGDNVPIYINGAQQKRYTSNKYLTPDSLKEFSELLVVANVEIENFLSQ